MQAEVLVEQDFWIAIFVVAQATVGAWPAVVECKPQQLSGPLRQMVSSLVVGDAQVEVLQPQRLV